MSAPHENAQERIVAKALSEPGFKQALLDDPKAAIAQEIGADVPEGVNVHVVEETPNDIYLVIPASPSESANLSDEELAGVAGGSATATGCGGIGPSCGAGSVWGGCD